MTDRVRIRMSAHIEDVPLVNEIVEFTPPKIKPKMAANQGAFVASEVAVGLEKLDWKLKVRGELNKLSDALGAYIMGKAQVSVTEKGQTTEGDGYSLVYSLYGPITGVEQDTVKMGDQPTVTISGTCLAFKQTDGGQVIHDINVNTGKTIIGGADLMKSAGINL